MVGAATAKLREPKHEVQTANESDKCKVRDGT